jgi:hypothetical protein
VADRRIRSASPHIQWIECAKDNVPYLFIGKIHGLHQQSGDRRDALGMRPASPLDTFKRLEQQTAGNSRITKCLFQSLKVLTQSFPPGTILETSLGNSPRTVLPLPVSLFGAHLQKPKREERIHNGLTLRITALACQKLCNALVQCGSGNGDFGMHC